MSNGKSQNNPPAKQTQVSVKGFSGPLPPPDILQRYDQIIPKGAERLLAMAEKEATHLQEMDRTAITFTHNERRRGQVFALIIGLSALAVAAFALYLGHPKTGATICATAIGGLAVAFITGRILKK